MKIKHPTLTFVGVATGICLGEWLGTFAYKGIDIAILNLWCGCILLIIGVVLRTSWPSDLESDPHKITAVGEKNFREELRLKKVGVFLLSSGSGFIIYGIIKLVV
jgi:hypothetical protein